MKHDTFPFDGINPHQISWKCDECGVMSHVNKWDHVEPYCDLCDSHFGRKCPACGFWFDGVYDEERLVRINEGLD